MIWVRVNRRNVDTEYIVSYCANMATPTYTQTNTPTVETQAKAVIVEWFMVDHFGRDLPAMRDDTNYTDALASYEEMYGRRAAAMVSDLTALGLLKDSTQNT